jgi:hypothetical protein
MAPSSRDHFEEGTGAGLGFVVATVLLAVLAVVLTRKPSQLALFGTAAVGLALFTKAVEAAGVVLAASLLRRPSLAITLTQPKGTLS